MLLLCALVLHAWIITTSHTSNQALTWAFGVGICILIVRSCTIDAFLLSPLLCALAISLCIASCPVRYTDIYTIVHTLFAGLLCVVLIVTGSKASLYLRQSRRLQKSLPPIINQPSLEKLGATMQACAPYGLCITTLLILHAPFTSNGAIDRHNTYKFILSMAVWCIFAGIQYQKANTLTQKQLSKCLLGALTMALLTSITCLLIR